MSVVVYVHCTKGKHFAPKFNEFFRCKKQISSNQWVLFLEPFFSRQWKSLRVIHPTLGSRIFLPTHLRMVSAGGGGRKCSVNWPWKFSLAYAFGAPNVLVLFLWKNVFFWRWTTQDSKGQVKILLQKTRDFLFPLFLIFFLWLNPFLFEFYIFLAPYIFFLKTVHPGVLSILRVWQKHRGCSHCGLHRDRGLSGRNFLSWPVRMPKRNSGVLGGDGWDGLLCMER